jgi:hypothetical protein
MIRAKEESQRKQSKRIKTVLGWGEMTEIGSYKSSGCWVFSIRKLYWKPEHPPPSTAILNFKF